MDYFYDLKPPAVSVPAAGDGLVQGFSSSFGPRLDARRAAEADENQWRETLNEFPANPGGFSRAQMFALGRDPKYRDIAIGMLTGRLKPEQLASAPQPRGSLPPPAFAPSRMATDADYQALPSGAAYFAPHGSWRTQR